MKIALIAPYSAIIEKAKKVAIDRGIELHVRVGELDKGDTIIEHLRMLEALGVQAFLSRGATQVFIKRYTHLPVISFDAGIIDLLYVLPKVRQHAKNEEIGIVLYRELELDASFFDLLFGIGIHFCYGYETPEEIRSHLKRLSSLGVRTVIGGSICFEYALKMGMTPILLETREESIAIAYNEVEAILQNRSKEQEELRKIIGILSHLNEAVILTGPEGDILTINPVARSLFKKAKITGAMRNVADMIPGLGNDLSIPPERIDPKESHIVSIGETSVVMNRIPVLEDGELRGLVVCLHGTEQIQSMEQKIRKHLAFSGHIARYSGSDFLGNSKAAGACRKQIEVYAPMDSTVLITGESGTGKEIVAQSIHNASRRSNGPFVAVNCSAVSANLLESELFGYDDGAFTGAKKGGKSGLFEQAHNGTIFLDEIGNISMEFQASLLRVIQEREVRRVGSGKNVSVDVRILAATNVDLNEKVKNGTFRLDLFYRLCVLHIHIPPLRERHDDIELLLQYFSIRFNGSPIDFPKPLLDNLLCYGWPGNVRELQNLAERVSLLIPAMSAEEVFRSHLDLHRGRFANGEISALSAPPDSMLVKKGTLLEMENQILTELYKECNQNKTILAERLNISRATVWNRLKTAKLG